MCGPRLRREEVRIMFLQKVFDLFHLLSKDKMSLFYQGVTHDDITDKLIGLSDENIRSQTALSRMRKRVSFAISECFQNIIRHKDIPRSPQAEHDWPSMFMVRNISNAYYIGSVNLINDENIDKLREQLLKLNELSEEELRSMYLQQLPTATFSEKGGAGLGLIEMARKSRQKFEFDFLSVVEDMSLFVIQQPFCEGRQETDRQEVTESSANAGLMPGISQVKDLYQCLQQQKVMLLYRSDFSQDGMFPLMDMMENNLKAGSGISLVSRKLMYVLVELYQNIVKHAANIQGRQEGILLVVEKGPAYEVYTGNFIRNTEVEALQLQLKTLVGLDQTGLKQLYREELIRDQSTTKGGAGLGLIETARYCSGQFRYEFLPIDSDISFFSLGIKL